ncbi:hypothetical protein VNO78_11430 [Psophocarpus tetragonolobus]|uniref:Leucine-rich repeat-containing N-terminal plant-type domain-containing protein n=1 Tax=Psophocarpus tetragonolobus TaxID=3891 RepID=A0AAN9SLE4_PSOTE
MSGLTILVLVVLALTPAVISELCNQGDKKALLKFKKELGNPTSLSTWIPKSDCCSKTWEGVLCETDNKTYRVNGLQLPQLNLSGPYPIPPSIANLPYLNYITISNDPNLVGPLPPTMAKLINLRNIDIHHTGISGNVPDFLSQIKTLIFINLSYNNLSGTLPASLSSLPYLVGISLRGNRISGAIPDSFGSFSNLQAMGLSGNRLTGKIPATLANLDLTMVDLSGNLLEGDASMLFGSNKRAQEIYLAENQLGFDLEKVQLSDNLYALDLRLNRIYGRLPKELATRKYLTFFNVSYNNLCGEIPQGGNMQRFDVSSYDHNNCLCGSPLPSCSGTLIAERIIPRKDII